MFFWQQYKNLTIIILAWMPYYPCVRGISYRLRKLSFSRVKSSTYWTVRELRYSCRCLYPNEPLIDLQKIPDPKIGVEFEDPSYLWCILIPGRVFRLFILIAKKQHVGPPLLGSLHQEVLGIFAPTEVQLQEFHFLYPDRAETASDSMGNIFFALDMRSRVGRKNLFSNSEF